MHINRLDSWILGAKISDGMLTQIDRSLQKHSVQLKINLHAVRTIL